MKKLFQKLIVDLYNKFCNVQVDTLYIQGIQRRFDRMLNQTELNQRNYACKAFVDCEACEIVTNEILKEYVEALFRYGEDEKARNIIHNNINVVMRVEDKIKGYALSIRKAQGFDPNEPL